MAFLYRKFRHAKNHRGWLVSQDNLKNAIGQARPFRTTNDERRTTNDERPGAGSVRSILGAWP
ncbi:hypothetical protein DTL42_07655 [Bremerella cremea]|uniref:Uncharacterized protein n=1 Tax=Bremerella cremea TaxID=1031537 RepID=A0A368KT20_9BACT|nr:hypothetical protein DTL42_07655 [Bremerella cremea]